MKPAARLFRVVLCPVDFSKHSSTALLYAAALVRKSKGQLFVLYVNEPFLIAGAAAAAYDARTLAEDTKNQLERFVARSKRTSGLPRGSVTCLVATGDAPTEIARTARRQKCSAIVLATRGLKGPSKLLLGSTTERLFHRTKIPILVIPPRTER